MKQAFKKLSAVRSLSAGLCAMLISLSVSAGTAVIVHPSNGNALGEGDISRIFLGKVKVYPDGSEAIPIDQSEGSASRDSFTSTILKKNAQQIQAYWAQLMFTGRGTPPQEMGSGAAVKKLVSENPAVIGYIDSSEVDGSVKVVYEF